MPVTVVAYYTRNTPYEKEAEVLKVSLEALGYEYDFLAIDNQGSWQKNTQYKAIAIEQLLRKHNRPILYLDVDAIMIQKPVILDTIDADIAAVHYNGSTELLSGTLYLTPAAMPVIHRWQELNRLYPEYLPDGRKAWDQRTLRLAIFEHTQKGLRYYELPQEYTWIVELTQKSHPGLAPVILHTRGSLRFGQD